MNNTVNGIFNIFKFDLYLDLIFDIKSLALSHREVGKNKTIARFDENSQIWRFQLFKLNQKSLKFISIFFFWKSMVLYHSHLYHGGLNILSLSHTRTRLLEILKLLNIRQYSKVLLHNSLFRPIDLLKNSIPFLLLDVSLEN